MYITCIWNSSAKIILVVNHKGCRVGMVGNSCGFGVDERTEINRLLQLNDFLTTWRWSSPLNLIFHLHCQQKAWSISISQHNFRNTRKVLPSFEEITKMCNQQLFVINKLKTFSTPINTNPQNKQVNYLLKAVVICVIWFVDLFIGWNNRRQFAANSDFKWTWRVVTSKRTHRIRFVF